MKRSEMIAKLLGFGYKVRLVYARHPKAVHLSVRAERDGGPVVWGVARTILDEEIETANFDVLAFNEDAIFSELLAEIQLRTANCAG